MTQGIRPDGQLFASKAEDGELQNFPSETRGWGVTIDGKDGDGNIVAEPTNGIPPMEWMNGILNKLSNQILWNMRHAIPAWMAGAWDIESFVTYNGWVYYNGSGAETSDTPDNSTAWVKLFPLSNIDGRYLQISKNLSEIAANGVEAQSEALNNLGAGTAATHDDDEYVKSVNGHLPEEGAITLTAEDVNALSKNGGEVNGTVIIKRDDAGLILQPTNEDDANYVLLRNADGSDRAFIGAGSNGSNDITLSSYAGGNNITFFEDGSISISSASGKYIKVTGQIDVPLVGQGSFGSQNGSGAPIYQKIDSTQTSQYNPIFKQYYAQGDSTWSGGTIISDNNFLIHHTDSSGASLYFRFSQDGTFTPGTYSNFDARYVKSTQLGTEGWASNDGTVYAPTGCVVTGVGDSGSDNGSCVYRPDQYIINGVPYTAAYTSTLQSLPTDSVNVMSMPPISHINELINCQPYNNIFLSSNEVDDGKSMISLRDEGGLDFYLGRQLLTGSVFIAYENDSGIIRQIDTNPLTMWPMGMSMRGLDSIPEGCNIVGGTWVYDAETDTVSQSPERVASWNRSGPYGKRLRAATGAFMLLQLLPPENAAEKTAALKGYLTELQAVDLAQPDPIWPEWPEILSQ